MAFREVLVTQVTEVLRAWLAGAGKRPAARRAGVDVKTADYLSNPMDESETYTPVSDVTIATRFRLRR